MLHVQVQREGKDITLVGFGKMVGYNLEAAKELEKEGVSAEVGCSSLPGNRSRPSLVHGQWLLDRLCLGRQMKPPICTGAQPAVQVEHYVGQGFGNDGINGSACAKMHDIFLRHHLNHATRRILVMRLRF